MQCIGIHSSTDHPRIRYTVAFLDGHPLCRQCNLRFKLNNTPAENHWNISYGQHRKDPYFDFFIPAQRIFFVPDQEPAANWTMNPYTYGGEIVHSVELKKTPELSGLISDRQFQFDLLETLFFHISRYEEVFAPEEQLGSSGWLNEEVHLLVQKQLEQLPQVDRLVACVLEIITQQKIQQPTTYDLTHDIDFLHRYPDRHAFIRALGGALYRREGLSTIRHHWKNYYALRLGKGKDPYDCFNWLLSEGKNWRRKTLYVMTGGETSYDNHYSIKDPTLLRALDIARERGYELGLHPSYNAAFKSSLFRYELKKMQLLAGKPIHRSRQHWLRFDWHITPSLFARHGIREDASMGYRQRLGFRCGTGFPYQMYDFANEQAFPWQEWPLVCMESAAIHQARALGVDPIDLFQAFFRANRYNTHISINFHNSNFDPALAAGRQLADFYRSFILPLGK